MEKIIPEHRIQCSFRSYIQSLNNNVPSPVETSQNTYLEPDSAQNNATRQLDGWHNTDNISPTLGAFEHNDQNLTHHDHPSTSRNINNTTLQKLHFDTTTCNRNININDRERHTFLSQFETTNTASAKSNYFESNIPTETCAKNTETQDTTTISHYGNGNIMDSAKGKQQNRFRSNESTDSKQHTIDRTVLWRKSGPVFVPPLPPTHVNKRGDSNTIIKHDVLLCNQLIYSCNGKQSSVYKQTHTHSTQSKRQEDWRQLEVVLTPNALTCYTFSGLVWPKRTMQYHISMNSTNDSNLSLYLLSPLEYTFCLQYTPTNEKNETTLVFQARSLTLCQEWYMAIYQQLPDHSRKPTPHECKIYIPSINIYVHLPLVNLQQSQVDNQQNRDQYEYRYFITMDHVKEAIMDLLENDSDWQQAILGNEMDRADLSLCWIREERAEWIFWKNSLDGNQVIDMALCPQNIEKSHQLELRPVQHTPHTIILADDTTLKEPYPCEGFLTKITSFEGRDIKAGVWTPKRFYFASFDGFLFVIPDDKAIAPHSHTYVKHANRNGFSTSTAAGEINAPFTTLVTPFADDNNTLRYAWQQEELTRRMKLMADAVGCINLTEVSFVRRSSDIHSSADIQHPTLANHNDINIRNRDIDRHNGIISSDLATSSTSLLAQDQSFLTPSLLSDGYQHGNKQLHSIELVMENGIIIKLEACASETCDQWISGLSDLILYSKARLEADRERCGGNNNNNTPPSMKSMTGMCEKEDTGSNAREPSICHHGPSGINHSAVDTRIWSLCLFTQCRDILKSGTLYMQSKGVFSQKQFILAADGRLHYFNVFKRSGDDGQLIQTGMHNRKGTLDMANAYIYSGMMSILDDKSSQTRLDRPPRVFDNGIATNDSDENCLFTIWIPERRRIFSPRRQSIITYRSDRRFNSTGQRWLFMAPSKQDKEEWIWAIGVIQEQLLREATSKTNICPS